MRRVTYVRVKRCIARVVCGLALLAWSVPAAGEATQAAPGPADPAALSRDMQAVRKSVDDLVSVMKQFLAESGRRERAMLLVRRLEVAEQQAARLAAELRTVRGALDTGQRAVEQSRSRLQSARNMEQMDRSGTAAPMLLQEQQQAMADEAAAQNTVTAQQQRIADLEAELASKQALIRNLEAALDREIPPPPR